jgi:hypothetical protein
MPGDQEFLLYPLDTGEDPACLDCGTVMMVAGQAGINARSSGLGRAAIRKLRCRSIC